jgi:hypothetical protein
VYDLTAARTEPCSTPHTCVVCRTTTDWAVVPSRWSARWTHNSPQICWDVRRQGFKICLSQFQSENLLTTLRKKHGS